MKKGIFLLLILLSLTLTSCQKEKILYIATTTSLDNSGLLDYLIPHFEEEYDVDVDIVAVGTGAALELGKNGSVEILLVHDYDREVLFVEDGYGEKRANIMYNDFILIGPDNLDASSLQEALNLIKENHNFYSRGDGSGTHSKELSLWEENGFDPEIFTDFYEETGQGMGSTITMANLNSYYTLTDRATYLSMLDNITLKIAYENKQELKNQYGVIKVNKDLYDKSDEIAELFYNWIQEENTQELITQYRKYNTQLFYID